MVVKVHQFKSDLTISPFAPSWNFIIAEKKIDIDVDNLSRLILDKASPEYEITNAPNCKSYFFNVLKWDHPICKELHDNIRTFHNEYLYGTIGQTKFPEKLLKIRCWANVMRKGEKIKRHCHASHPFTYLSGHFTVKCDNTSTNYFNVYTDEYYPIKNAPSQMTLFPTWIPHSTDRQ